MRDGESVVSPVNLRFAVDGFGVAPNGFGAEGSGHFVLDVLRNDNSAPQNVDLNNGATQATLVLMLVLVLVLVLVAVLVAVPIRAPSSAGKTGCDGPPMIRHRCWTAR